jgi:hypothetical protein
MVSMNTTSEESFRAKVREILVTGAKREAVARLRVAVDGEFHAAVARAYPHLSSEIASELAFHLSDWREDAAFIVALALSPDRFTAEEVEDGLTAFLVHAPNHVAAAAKLGGWPIADIFEIGALDAGRDHQDPAV